jgi:hypothetical protein
VSPVFWLIGSFSPIPTGIAGDAWGCLPTRRECEFVHNLFALVLDFTKQFPSRMFSLRNVSIWQALVGKYFRYLQTEVVT